MKLGNKDILLALGGNVVDKAYLGAELVYQNVHLPYDAEVEYLEISGTQFIEIIMSIDNACVVSIDGYIGQTNKELISLPQAGQFASAYQFNMETASIYYRYFFTTAITQNENNIGVRHLWECGTSLYRDSILVGSKTPTLTGTRDALCVFKGTHGIPNSGRIYSLKVEKAGQTLLDAIPVRVGTTGYMYDSVSGNLFGNAGTGDFILGSDV